MLILVILMGNSELNKKSLIKQHLEYYKNFLITKDEAKYYEMHKMDEQKEWFEIYELQKDMNSYGEFLKSVSLPLRRKLLLNLSGTNYSYGKIEKEYGVSKQRLMAYAAYENRQKSLELYIRSQLAILTRVPLEWLENDRVYNLWSIDHFRFISPKRWQWDEFLNFINTQYTHTIRGLILVDHVPANENELVISMPVNGQLAHQKSEKIKYCIQKEHYLRVEVNENKVMIEIFSEVSGYTLQRFREKLPPTKYKMGFAQTVIPNHTNVVFYSGYIGSPYPYIQ